MELRCLALSLSKQLVVASSLDILQRDCDSLQSSVMEDDNILYYRCTASSKSATC
jgi:hypothetical protein